jgi:hypothetical protein
MTNYVPYVQQLIGESLLFFSFSGAIKIFLEINHIWGCLFIVYDFFMKKYTIETNLRLSM